MRHPILMALAIVLAGCTAPPAPAPVAPSSSTSTSDSADPGCASAFAAAATAGDADATAAALEDAMGVCRTPEEWTAAADRHADGLDEVDPQQFLVDRCLNGPPDIADSTLCQGVEVDR